ncbi:Type I inositol 1,4,5-trisphosphate 5-phosphatase 13 [Acorus calamus]|uniref:Type I inositol 1,4,5-trisphosphate 5-phosphatase 13 n=1 Tax=Acorus calamus TaxID=4465 RepID=A0AAV9D067_ACOCL|nr:Type I inositol 1,4,5-trisphosphate 5-phosphatase 13 [Acorus calamus]
MEDFVDGIPQNWWSEDTRDKEAILLEISQEKLKLIEFAYIIVSHPNPHAAIQERLQEESNQIFRTGTSV